ncbi:scavenger receptor cysteine-rich type 1 protein M160 isoform X2 [Thunnus albacares]|uniref:scavenger receptor cysteine-rich type 1 protein M160 isoform X2 n=1 Tax=Thunnus albacares TaxID=8236 RepID=UPI001CF6A440|nr:scavenger receptor cysteine-rich type 1 protein M160 isoform X2 [Thunnus albacares]
MMWFLLLLYIAHIEQVIIEADKTGSRLILEGKNGSCEGYVKIYKDNSWSYVGDKHWNSSTEKVVCRSTHCGETENSTEDVLYPTDAKVFVNELECDGTESHLLDCKYPGWNVSYYRKPSVKKMKCSNKIKIDLDGFKCAGAVRYSTDGKTPSGYFCNDNWGEKEANHLCEKLKCGNSAGIPSVEWMVWEGFKTSKKMKIERLNKQLTDLWQCVTQESTSCSKPASVICTDYKRLQLRGNASNVCSGELEIEENNNWTKTKPEGNQSDYDEMCRQMYCGTSTKHSDTQLTCSDIVKVVLDGDSKRCYGNVHISVNNITYPVCASSWTKSNAEMVCKELNCGSLMESKTVTNIANKGIMDYVNCTGKESSLWHCKAKRHNKPFQCTSMAHVVCSDSIQVNLTDGPGKCAGRLEIKYEGQWKKVSKNLWAEENSDTVCKQLECGKAKEAHSTEKFSTGSNQFLQKKVTCKKASKISECEIHDGTSSDEEAVGIICKKHKVVFLDDPHSSCSGKVGIENDNNISWLSGSNVTWNKKSADTVCRQIHCGTAQSFNYTRNDDKRNAISKKSYSCSSNNTSLFDCETNTLPSDHNDTIATVICSGEIKINLTKTCWGKVNICMDGNCGGVCAATWGKNMSKELCKQLDCGTVSDSDSDVLFKEDNTVIVKSMHMSKRTDNLTKCSFVMNDNAPCEKAVHVVCSDSIKPKLQISRDNCSGNLEMEYEGELLPVCKDALKDKNTQNIICKELKCGLALNAIDYFGPESNKKRFISEVKCPANESLIACDVHPSRKPCNLGGLQCSNWKTIILNESCSGTVLLQSEGKNLAAVSAEGFSKEAGERLCEDLDCGNYVEMMEKNSDNSLWNRSFNCTGVENPPNIWGCEKPRAATQKQQLSIKCEGEPKVNLTEKCKGQVMIDGIEVCNSTWNHDYSHMVCQELDCSNAFPDNFNIKSPEPRKKYYHVNCEKHHYLLGQCKRFKGKCEGKLVSVSCVENVKFNTTQKCGGQLKVNYGKEWKEVCPLNDQRIEENPIQKVLCKSLKCGNPIAKPSDGGGANTRANLETTLTCTKDHKDIKHCVHPTPCTKIKPAEIYCEGYKPPPPIEEDNKIPVVPIILGVGFLLVLVILIVVFVRICIVRKAKNVSSRIFSRKEVEFESGDVEDFNSKANEMEDFGHGRFRSEAEFIEEHDARSTSSFSYDDIDEVDEARPLTSQADSAGTSGENYIPESALDQSTDGVTYEVDDPQENYDDIEASPEITETQAEVHDGPKTTPEREAVIAGLVPEDEDYLVPGQDG